MTSSIGLLLAPSEITMHENFLANLPPLSLGVLAGYLRSRGITVYLHDLNFGLSKRWGSPWREVLEQFYRSEAVMAYLDGRDNPSIDAALVALLEGIDLAACDVIGISCGADFSWMQIHSAFLIGAYIQRAYRKPIIFGGNNLTYLYQFKDTFRELWECLLRNFRYLVIGPGEVPLYHFMDALRMHGAVDPASLPGVAYKKDDQIDIRRPSLPTIQRPDFDGLALDGYLSYIREPDSRPELSQAIEATNQEQIFKMDSFLVNLLNKRHAHQPGYVGKLIIPYVFNYNCPFRCAFCSESAADKQGVILGEARAVVDDIEHLMMKYRSNYFYFFNNAINYSRKFVREFCAEVARRGLQFYWSDCARFNDMDLELLRLLKDAGCRKLVFGFETASRKLLELIDKRVTLDQARRVLEWCQQVRIWVDLEIIVGLPHEHEAEFVETCDFLAENDHLLNHVHINQYFIVPTSLIGSQPKQYGIKILRDVFGYEDMLRVNREWFMAGAHPLKQPRNFHIYRYDEIDGRTYREVEREAQERVDRLAQLQYRKYANVWRQFI